jgi:hypothetical protein
MTVGNTITINPNWWFDPTQTEGRRAMILAHEVTHVVQNEILGTDAVRSNAEKALYGENGYLEEAAGALTYKNGRFAPVAPLPVDWVGLFQTPITVLNPVDSRWPLEALADRVAFEFRLKWTAR